jgi:hypothetical protein
LRRLDSVSDLEAWIRHKLKAQGKSGAGEHVHTTRMMPKRSSAELLAGGSLYCICDWMNSVCKLDEVLDVPHLPTSPTTEHVPGVLDENVLELAQDVDLMIYDCTYTDEEYPANAGRGHSTWQQGVRVADAAGAKRLAIFHHDPAHDDAMLDRLARQAKAVRPGTIVAAEGLTLRFPPG